MSFNYRMIRHVDGEDYVFNIHEVYYDKDGKVKSWSENPIHAQGDTPIDCLEDLCLMQQAFHEPIMEINSENKGKEKLVEIVNINRVIGK